MMTDISQFTQAVLFNFLQNAGVAELAVESTSVSSVGEQDSLHPPFFNILTKNANIIECVFLIDICRYHLF